MRSPTLIALGFIALAIGAGSFTANAQDKMTKPTKADNTAIAACLQDVNAANEKYAKLSDKQKGKADEPSGPESCLGTVSGACQEKIKGDPNKGLTNCNNRELAVWKAFMDRRVSAFLKGAKPAESAAMKKVQSSWAAHRDARCGFAAIDNKDKGLASALMSACVLDMTSKQALWIDTREN